MKFIKKSIFLFFLAGLFLFSACGAIDLVAKVAVTSFNSLVKAIPDKVAFDSTKGGWTINGIDDKESIMLSTDFSSSNPDVAVEFDADPFVKAGLDVSKLPTGQYTYDKSTGKITMPFEYGQDKFGAGAEKSAFETFKEIVKTHRNIIGYHEEGDHYKLALGNGNSLAWAKDLSTNKIDLGYILNPKPFIDAGVDTSKIKEWIFTKMPVTDKDGKAIQVNVLMKVFNVK